MAGWASYAAFKTAIDNGLTYDYSFYKAGPTNQGAGTWMSLWYASGTPGAGGDPAATPGTAYDNDAASINFPDLSTTKYPISFGILASQPCCVMLYDRLVAVSGLSMTITTDQAVNSTALPRYSGTEASVVSAWAEITTAVTGGGSASFRMAPYTNEVGNSVTGGTVNMPGANVAVRSMIRLPTVNTNAGNKGVRSVETFDMIGGATTGACNIVLLRAISYVNVLANVWNEIDLMVERSSFPSILDGASLALALMPLSTTAVNVEGRVLVAY